MLAQSFMTAEELGVTEEVKDALIKTLVLLETGKLTHYRGNRWNLLKTKRGMQFSGHFNMSTFNTEISDCKTVCCICGTAELIGGIKIRFVNNDNLRELFMPSVSNYDRITPAQAAIATRSWLTTGSANWQEIEIPNNKMTIRGLKPKPHRAAHNSRR